MSAANSEGTQKSDRFLLSSSVCPGQRTCWSLLPLLAVTKGILTLDVLLGLLYIYELLLLHAMSSLVPKAQSQLLLSVISDGVSLALVPFAVLGFVAVFKPSRRLFSVYLCLKGAESLFMLVFWPGVSHIYCLRSTWTCLSLTFFFVCLRRVFFNVYSFYCILRTYQTWRTPSPLSQLKPEEFNEDR